MKILPNPYRVYKIGDKVRIVNPEIVKRVGYPMSLQDARDHVEKALAKKVTRFCRGMEGLSGKPASVDPDYDIKLYEDMMQTLASHYIRSKRFGGPERSIYTELQEDLKDIGPWKVISKRMVKTGTYNAGYTDHYGDYTGPYLENQKTHILLTLEIYETSKVFGIMGVLEDLDRVEIGVDNVTILDNF